MHIREIVVLVTGVALDRFSAVAVGAATYLHGVAMRISTLAREVSGRVAIHATRMAEDRCNELKSCDGLCVAGVLGWFAGRRRLGVDPPNG